MTTKKKIKLSDKISGNENRQQNLKRMVGALILIFLLFAAYENWKKQPPSPAPPPKDCPNLASLNEETRVREAVQSCWKSYFATFDTATSYHFRCRLNCRKIKIQDIYHAIENGSLQTMDLYGCKNRYQDSGKMEPCLKISGKNYANQELIVVLTFRIASRQTNFVTAYLKKGGDQCETDCDFSGE